MTDDQVLQKLKPVSLNRLSYTVRASLESLKEAMNENISLYEIKDSCNLIFINHKGKKPNPKRLIKAARQAMDGAFHNAY